MTERRRRRLAREAEVLFGRRSVQEALRRGPEHYLEALADPEVWEGYEEATGALLGASDADAPAMARRLPERVLGALVHALLTPGWGDILVAAEVARSGPGGNDRPVVTRDGEE